MKTVIVTGGAGYIGSHIVKLFARNAYRVISLDITGTFGFESEFVREHVIDIRQITALEQIFEKYAPVDCVIHCAGELGIERSYKEMAQFYSQNVYATECILNTMVRYGVKKILYSSSAALYPTSTSPLREGCILAPHQMSPYSYNKYMCEEKLSLMASCMDIDYIAFRYFNVVGCNTECVQSVKRYLRIPNIIPMLVNAAQNGHAFHINGCDYDTPDGTCVRDYVDVEDLAVLHLKACEAILSPLWNKQQNGVYNAGSGQGISIEEMIQIFEDTTMQCVDRDYVSRRAGDAAYLCADIGKTQEVFLWTPRNDLRSLFGKLWVYSMGNQFDSP